MVNLIAVVLLIASSARAEEPAPVPGEPVATDPAAAAEAATPAAAAPDAPPSFDCSTLAGWSAQACKADAAGAAKVLDAAGARLTELGDCSVLKKKADLTACAAETADLASTAISAGKVLAALPR